MINLKKCIVIYDSNPILDRISLSQGTSLTIEDSRAYFFPTLPFRTPTLQEQQILYTDNPDKYTHQNKVSITALPKFLFDPLSEIGLNNISTFNDYLRIKIHPLYCDIFSYIDETIKLFLVNDSNFKRIGLTWKEPNLFTTTKYPSSNTSLGLHLDYWDKSTMNNLKNSRNRICINLSKESRYLLFINLSIVEIDQLLREQKIYSADSREVRVNFLKHFPGYSVVKVKIQPFEAYIAPTEWVIHDGSTFNNKHCDLTLTYLGHFDITPKANAFYLECNKLMHENYPTSLSNS